MLLGPSTWKSYQGVRGFVVIPTSMRQRFTPKGSANGAFVDGILLYLTSTMAMACGGQPHHSMAHPRILFALLAVCLVFCVEGCSKCGLSEHLATVGSDHGASMDFRAACQLPKT